jgi:hypothetical protein
MPENRFSDAWEDVAVACFSLLGLVGSVVLYYLKFPSVMISVFLSAGITALVYRFLGGIKGATFAVGSLKLGGAIAVLIGVAYWIDSTKQLDPQCKFHMVCDYDSFCGNTSGMVGTWDWKAVFPKDGWDGHLTFSKSSDGKLTFTGQEYRLEADGKGGTTYRPVFEMTNGKAVLSDNGTTLTLESDVKESKEALYGRTFHWKSEEPLILIPAFGGRLWPKSMPGTPPDPGLEAQPWGILITKDTSH